MDIRHLKLIKAVAEYKSLTKAADKLFLTQSALSHQVKEIEDEYSTKFFLRINKQMLLTPAGERLLQTAQVILQEIERNNDDLKKLLGKDSGIIRISTECYTCYHWLSSFLREFRSRYPKVEVRIIAEATSKTDEFLDEGKLDVALVSDKKDNPHFAYHKLFDDEVVAVFAVDHPWKEKKFILSEDFKDQTLLIYNSGLKNNRTYRHVFEDSGTLPAHIMKIDLTEAIIEMVKANLGVAILAKWAVGPYLKSNSLLSLPIGPKGFHRTWYAATLIAADSPDYMQDFIASLAKHTKKEVK